MACWVIRRPIHPWHFARIFLIPSSPTLSHLFRTMLIWIWTTIRACPRGSHLDCGDHSTVPSSQGFQKSSHATVAKKPQTTQSLFALGFNYSYSRWGQELINFHRFKAKLQTARTLRIFARTGDWDTPLRPFFGLIRKHPFHRQ